MPIQIKSWAKFQHFKDRKPPWVKLYRDLLDDMEWHRLDAKAAKALIMLWLIASENDGVLPDEETLAFRLRTTETEVKTTISKLSHWLIQDDISAISTRYQGDGLETEEEKRREETEQRARDFETFWKAYPRKDGKQDAMKAWKTVTATLETLLTAIATQRTWEQWTKDKGQFIPMPGTWLRGLRWLDAGQSDCGENAPDSKASIEADGVRLGLGKWDCIEHWTEYKARVRAAQQGVTA